METSELRDGPRKPAERDKVLISIRGASKKFCRTLDCSLRYMAFDALHDLLGWKSALSLRPGEFWALRNISLDLRAGESLAVMGLNGAGKSTLLKLVLGSLRLTEGEIAISGQVSMLSEHGLGFDPLLTGRENVYLAAAVLGMDRRRAFQVFDEIVAFAELQESIDSPVRGYSTGMRARLGFSVAMHLKPEILLVDEVLTVGDIGFQRRCIQHAQSYLQHGGSLLLVSHNPHLVQLLCDRCIVLDHGIVLWDGDAVEGVGRYLQAARTPLNHPVAQDGALTEPCTVAPEISGDMIAIDGYDMRPLDDQALRTNEPARVRLRYTATRPLNVRWGFSLLSSDLTTAITSGRGELVATIPRLPLVPGRYALRVAILDPETEMPYALGGFDAPPRYFTVEASVTRRNNYRMYTGDLVVLEKVEWSHGVANQSSEATA
jgi:ABC-type polysaccharide/polyol phosphate transport system ATPase subunit